MDDCTAINLVKHVNICLVQVGIVCAAWWHLRELSQQSNNSCIRTTLCTQTQNFDEDSFDMLYKIDSWTAISDLIWTTNVPYERKINMLSSTDNNFKVFLFNCEIFRIESRFPFLKKWHCICFRHQVHSKWFEVGLGFRAPSYPVPLASAPPPPPHYFFFFTCVTLGEGNFQVITEFCR